MTIKFSKLHIYNSIKIIIIIIIIIIKKKKKKLHKIMI